MAHPMDYSVLVVRSSFPSKESAIKMVKELAGEKLIASGSVYPVTTISADNISTTTESFMLEVLAPRKSFELTAKYMEEHAQASVPMVLTRTEYVNAKYFDWSNQTASYIKPYPVMVTVFFVTAMVLGVVIALFFLRKI